MKDEKKSVGDLDTGAATTTSPIHPNEIRIGDTKYILSKDSHGHYQYTLSKETHPHHQGERYVWRCIWDASKNKPYYWNRSTGNRVWALPAVRVDPLNESKAETRSAAPKVSLRPVRSTLPDTSTNSPCKTEEGCSGASDGVDTRSIGPTVLAVLRKNMQRLKSEGSTEEPQSCGTQNNIPGAQAQSSPKRACGIIAVTDGSSSALPHGSATLQDSVIEHAAPPSTTTLPGKNPASYSYSFATSYEVPAHDIEATDVNHCVTSGSDSLHGEQSLAVSSPDGTTYRDRLHEIRERKARVLSQSQSCIRTDVQLEPGSIESQRANPRSVSVDPHPKESADSGALGRHPVPIGPTIFPHGVMKEPHAYDPSSIIINVNAEGFDTAPPKEVHSQDPASQGPEDSVDDEPLAHNMKTTFTESSRVTQGTPENGGTNHPSKEASPLTPIELSTYVCDAVHSAYGLASDGIPLGIPFGTHCVLHNGSFQDDTLIPDAFSFTGYADIHLLERNTETEGTNSALEDRRRSIKKSDSTRRCGLVPRIVVAEFDKNVMKSPGNIVFSTGDVLTWKWCNRDRPGTGDVVIQYVNGDVYEGALVNFKKQGEGCLRFKKSGYTYHGMFHHGLMHGQGKLVFLNGSVYEGAFAHQTLSGRATYTARSEIGSVPLFVYDGMFEQGYMHGHGRIEYPNGDIWEGTWKKDKKWMGKYIFSRQFVL